LARRKKKYPHLPTFIFWRKSPVVTGLSCFPVSWLSGIFRLFGCFRFIPVHAKIRNGIHKVALRTNRRILLIVLEICSAQDKH
jgi:hypothetical protein